MSRRIKLRPCPLCGSDALPFPHGPPFVSMASAPHVICRKCKARVSARTMVGAARKWNRRVED